MAKYRQYFPNETKVDKDFALTLVCSSGKEKIILS